MPFGLTGAPGDVPKKKGNESHSFLLYRKVRIHFIDDILIYSKSVEEHITHLQQVLKVFNENKLKINIEKCSFLQTEVEILGHKVS